MKCTKFLSCRHFLQEFHYSRFWFTFGDWRSLVYIPWLPYKWPFQIIHVIYRWVVAFYFLGWLIASGVKYQGATWMIFLTNWAIVGFVFYLILAALSVTAKFITVHACKKFDYQDFSDRTSDYQFKKPKGCCGYGSNQLSWYQMIHWASFLSGEISLAVTILYWALLFRGGAVDGINANTHLVNGIVSLVDVVFFGVPISLFHFIYPLLFSMVYSGFTGIYYAAGSPANGTDPGNIVYPVLSYGQQPVSSSIVIILVVFLFIPIIHLVYYALYLARFWLVYAIYGRSKVSCWGVVSDQREHGVENLQATSKVFPLENDIKSV